MVTTGGGDDDPKGQVVNAANRLRAVQADFADVDRSTRGEFIQEELDRALATVPPDRRRAFLEQLMDRFPSWDQAEPAVPAAAGAPAAAAEPMDFPALVARLAAVAPTVSAQDRAAAADRLAAVGVAHSTTSTGGWSAQDEANLRAKFGLAENEQLNAGRLAEMLLQLFDLAAGMDLLAWNTWKQIAPQSPTRRQTPLTRLLGRFAAGDPEVPKSVATAEVARLRRLVAALISSVGQVGSRFAQDFCGQFAPGQIEDVVKAQGGGGLFGNPKAKFWDHYVQMAAGRDPVSIEHEFVTAFAEYAELLMKSTGR